MRKLLFVVIAMSTIATLSLSSCEVKTSTVCKNPDLSAVVNDFYLDGGDTVVSKNCESVRWDRVFGKNCDGKPVSWMKPNVVSNYESNRFLLRGDQPTSEMLVNRIHSLGYDLVRNSNAVDSIPTTPVQTPNPFWLGEWAKTALLLFLLFLILLLMALVWLVKQFMKIFHPNTANSQQSNTVPQNGWTSENIQKFADDLHIVVKDAVAKGKEVSLKTTSNANSTDIDLKISGGQKEPVTGEVKKEEAKPD